MFKEKKSKQCYNKFNIKINKDISNKFKNVLSLKKGIIVLINCLIQKDILNNISLMHHIPLQYKIRNNTLPLIIQKIWTIIILIIYIFFK